MYLPAWDTLPETNIASENWPFQKESSLPTIFRCYVSFREGSHKSLWKKNTSTWPLLPFANVRLRQLPCKGRWPSPLVGEKNPTSWPRLVTILFKQKKPGKTSMFELTWLGFQQFWYFVFGSRGKKQQHLGRNLKPPWKEESLVIRRL